MSAFLDKAIAYTRQERQSSLLSVEVKKLGETIYFKPLGALSVERFDQVLAGENANNVDGMITALIVRAMDKDGHPLFNPMDRIQMKKEMGPLLIAEIVRSMGAAEGDSETVEDLEKNL
jgi:hypothetical protein